MAVAVCISSAVSTSAGPVGKSSKNVIESLLNAPRPYRGKIRHYVFPTQTANRIAAQAPLLDRQVNAAATTQRATAVASQYTPTHAPVVLGHSPKDISFTLRSMIAATPLEKEVLIANEKEQAFYQTEITDGRNLNLLLDSLHYIGDEEMLALGTAILQTIKNHALQTYLLKALTKKQVLVMQRDLSEYFCFNKPFAVCAFSYTVRHPHQQILMMRRLLNNPLVDEDVKARVRTFLAKPQITLEDSPQFVDAINQLYNQYHRRMLAAQESEVIQMQVAYYTKLIDRLGDFIAKHERIPKWNTTDPQEAQLFDELEWVELQQQNNTFEPIASYQQTIELTLQMAAPAYLTQDETVALFEQFVKETHRIYPRSLRDKGAAGQIPFAREEELWDNLSYWRIQDASINQRLADVYQKYPNTNR